VTAREIRVIQIVNTLSVSDGGPARNSYELNLALNATQQISARLVWIRGAREYSVLRDSRDPLPSRMPTKLILGGVGFKSLWEEFVTSDVVVIHGYFLWWVPLVAVLASAQGIPFVLTPHGSLTRHQRTFSRGRKRAYELLAGWFVRQKAAAFVVGSHRERVELVEKFPALRAVVSGAGTQLTRLYRGQTWNVPLQLLSLGRIAPKKRLDLSVMALAELQSRGVQAELTIAGSGDSQLIAALQALISRHSLSRSVTFVGEVSGTEKIAQLARADIFLAPSDDENFGIAVAEALASGLPVVASTAVASVAGLDFPAGVVLPSPDPESIADAVQSVIGRSRADVEEASATFAERFSWRAVAASWAELLPDLRSNAGQLRRSDLENLDGRPFRNSPRFLWAWAGHLLEGLKR
jgi:glycosyltransferase involved in cell wall biosynthesis